MDVMESCQACMDRPRAVRLACGHATFCELCTILAVKATGLNCSVCRCAATTLVVVPVTSTAELPLKRMPTFAEKREQGRAYASVLEFLQAKVADPSLLVAVAVPPSVDKDGEMSPGSRRRKSLSDDSEVAEEARKALLRVSEQQQQVSFTIDAEGHVTVPEGVAELADYVFDGKTSLVSIDLPASLTRIGSRAFRGCKLLVLTSLPNGITNIGYSAFRDCKAVALTSLPNGLTSIGDYTFKDCSSLALTSLPDSLTSIGNFAFSRCRSLELTSLPIGLNRIGNHAFMGSTVIESPLLPGDVPGQPRSFRFVQPR